MYIIASLMIACRVWTCHFQDMNTTKVKVDIFSSKDHLFIFLLFLLFIFVYYNWNIWKLWPEAKLKENRWERTWRRKNLESFEEWELRVSQQPPFSAGSTNIDLKRMPRYNLGLKLKGKKKMPNLSSDELFSRLSSIKNLELGQTSFSLRSSNSSFARNYNCTCWKNPVSK